MHGSVGTGKEEGHGDGMGKFLPFSAVYDKIRRLCLMAHRASCGVLGLVEDLTSFGFVCFLYQIER